jgi:hypothetical protein
MLNRIKSLIFAALLCLGVASAAGAGEPTGASTADFHSQPASSGARAIADWVVRSSDNQGAPFVIIDKKAAKVFMFGADGRLKGASTALLGAARGDDSVPGIGERKLSTIRPEERTTPAGRFVASLGSDLGPKDVIWIDYDAAISLHRVVTSNVRERRLQRLASRSLEDKRISYGCINVPARFFDQTIRPEVLHSSGVVYILPEVKSLASVFPAYAIAVKATSVR